MRLLIVHNHFRPGGVRRVVEIATPDVIRALSTRVEEIILLTGENPDPGWVRLMTHVTQVPVSCKIESALLYFAEQRRRPAQLTTRLREFLKRLMPPAGTNDQIIWAHNQGLGRNLLLTRELVRFSQLRSIPLVLHHHDWWFDNRWQRWPEFRRSGFHSLRQVAETVFSTSSNVRVIAINQTDASLLKRFFPRRASWLPNPTPELLPVSMGAARHARTWLHQQIAGKAPVWLLPCRLVRRKNIAEALLLTRWLRPEAWLVTTGKPSSIDEESYARRLTQAAQKHGWQLRLGVLGGSESGAPTIPELMAASEAILLTSLQEGFGLPYVEAVLARRPLIARLLPNMAPDLRKFGFEFPQSYREVLIPPCLFDWAHEQKRQRVLFHRWCTELPPHCRAYVENPLFLRASRTPRAVPFSRLTLAAQFEVLSRPTEESFNLCAPLNPELVSWKRRAESGQLQLSAWPKSATNWLSGQAYGRKFSRLLKLAAKERCRIDTPLRIQEAFLHAKLAAANLYPLLWSTEV